VSHIRENRNVYRVLVGNPERKNIYKCLRLHGRILFVRIFGKCSGEIV
jgi:hypothetical protein